MTTSEPVTVLTDYLLGAVAVWLAARLAASSSRTGSRPQALWAGAFAVGALAAFAGGTFHGTRASLGPVAGALLWQCALLGGALAGTLLVAGAAIHALRGGALRVALVLLGAKGALELVDISRSGLAEDAVRAGASSIALLLALALLRAREDRAMLGWILLALALGAAGLAVQAGGLSPHPHFSHNDLFHVLMTAALWPFYRAGLRLR
jgi:hypothetical protein